MALGRQMTWEEFTAAFRRAHIPEGIMENKREEFLALTQGRGTVVEYLNKFNHLVRYAADEVPTNKARQRKFRKGLSQKLRKELILLDARDFEQLVDKAIAMEGECLALEFLVLPVAILSVLAFGHRSSLAFKLHHLQDLLGFLLVRHLSTFSQEILVDIKECLIRCPM